MSPNSRRGLTVVETLIAATLFLTAVVVLVGLYPASARAVRQAQGHLLATNIAQRELELSVAMDFDALEDRTQQYVVDIENNGNLQKITFDTQVLITDVKPGLKRIVVEMSWLGSDNFVRKLEMEGYSASRTP